MCRSAVSTAAVWLLLPFFVLLLILTAQAENSPAADNAWKIILEQADGPGSRFNSQEEALKAAAQHLDKQEAALRGFAQQYPADSRYYSAKIRLAAVIAAEGRLKHDPALEDAARKSLNDLETDPSTPKLVKADAGFARVSQTMASASGQLDEKARDILLIEVRQFDVSYPKDRRTGNLLTEIATLYDNEPVQKQTLLKEAAEHTNDEAARQRISDDLRRIELLGRPLDLRLHLLDGGSSLDLTQHHGHVQVILFWASFSLPALHELAALQEIAKSLGGQPVDFLTVSVDEDRAALVGTMKVADMRWPTHFDGQGWKGELVRSLGINALPTVWVLDRQGKLLTLNARGEEEKTIQQALATP